LATDATTLDRTEANNWIIAAFLTGAVVALGLGVYSRFHDGTFDTVAQLFFSSQLRMKVWLGFVAGILAIYQIVSAEMIYGRIKLSTFPKWLVDSHRLSGLGAFLFSLPVAYHCLWSIGFDFGSGHDLRVWAHSIAGLLFYGAFVTKLFVIRVKGLPDKVLPIAGGILFTALMIAVLTSVTYGFVNGGFGL
jgi:Family of unknown function (DUF6529)